MAKKKNKKKHRFSLNQIQSYWMGVGFAFAEQDGGFTDGNMAFRRGHLDNVQDNLAKKTLNMKKRK